MRIVVLVAVSEENGNVYKGKCKPNTSYSLFYCWFLCYQDLQPNLILLQGETAFITFYCVACLIGRTVTS